jgi:hypothetical protein
MVWIGEPAPLVTAGRVQRLLAAANVLGVRVASRRRTIDAPPLRLRKLPLLPPALQVAWQMLPVSFEPAPLRRLAGRAPVALGVAILMALAVGVPLPIVLLLGVAALPVALAPLVPRPAG